MILSKIFSQIPKLILTLFLEVLGYFIVAGVLGYRHLRLKPYNESFKAFTWFDNQSGQYGPDPTSFFEVWYWLCLRNPLNVFQYRVLGFEWKEPVIFVHYDEKPPIWQTSDESTSGAWYTEVEIERKAYWEYFMVKKWPLMNKCFRFRCGWKIGRIDSNKDKDHVQWCFTVTPFKEIT